MEDTLRRQDLKTLALTLQDQRTRSIDVVASAKSLGSVNGLIVLGGVEPIVSDEGVTTVDGLYRPTNVGNEGIASKLNIPSQYLRRLHEEHPSLYDENVNYFLQRTDARYLLRLLRTEESRANGVLRALLSDRYRTIDNFDVLMATLAGIRDAGLSGDALRIEADLTDRRMIVKVHSEAVALKAPELIGQYRSPFTGASGMDNPLVFAGFMITNSEVGGGSFSITPRAVWQVCTNGMTITKDAMREIHLGVRLDSGVVKPSARTIKRNLDLVTSQTSDAVAAFLSEDYLTSKVEEVRESMGVEIKDPPKVIGEVSKRLGFSTEDAADILASFTKGGSVTAGGVMQAITAVAQDRPDGDDALRWEAAALPALELAASMR